MIYVIVVGTSNKRFGEVNSINILYIVRSRYTNDIKIIFYHPLFFQIAKYSIDSVGFIR